MLRHVANFHDSEGLYSRQSSQISEPLRQVGIIQCTQSSNCIEDVTVRPDRLIQLMNNGTKPRERFRENAPNSIGRSKTLVRGRGRNSTHQGPPGPARRCSVKGMFPILPTLGDRTRSGRVSQAGEKSHKLQSRGLTSASA